MVECIIEDSNNEYLKVSRHETDAYAHHEIIFDRAGSPIDFIYLNVNDSFEKLIGVKRQQILGKRFTEVLTDLTHDEFDYIGEFGRIGAKGGNLTCEFYSKSLKKWFSVFIFSEKHGLCTTVFRDVTDERNLINKLHRANYLNEVLLDSIPHPALLINIERNVIAANKLAKEFGTQVGGFCWRDFAHCEFLNDEDKQYLESGNTCENRIVACNYCEANNALSANKSVKIEKKLGDSYWEIYWIPTQEENVYLHYSIDITERKKNESTLQETLEMDRLKTEFFANVSHELRTPLNIIFSTLQLFELYIRNGLADGIENKMLKGIKGMKQNSYRLLRLINNLIDVTKIDGNFISLQLENCDIVNVISKICLSVSEYMEGKNISFSFNTNVEGKTIACDLDKIETIILNLISNAVKFNKSGGNVAVNIFDEKDGILISVEDNGVGIPLEKKEKIFERFMQVDKSLARNHEGSGIGLSLVKHFIEMHGGQIWVESEYGIGSKFIFRLPGRVLETEEKNIMNDNSIKYHNDYVERINIEFSDIYT